MKHPFWRKVLETGTRIVMPEVCAGCGASGAWICETCLRDVFPIDLKTCCQRCGYPDVATGSKCPRCSEWTGSGISIRSAFVFSGPIRQSILRMKYRGEFARATWHAHHLEDVVRGAGWNGLDAIAAVPLHPRKLRKRGFNQSDKLAVAICERMGVTVRQPLVRVRETASQTSLGRDERQANVADAFSCSPDIAGMSILLVDDVATTCATLLACAEACLAAGARHVYAATIATDA
jgi:competence protein ComFC